MVFEDLYVKPGQRATSRWANSIVSALETLYGYGTRGNPDNPFTNLYAQYGFFSGNVYVQGKPVIKDGDPVNIYDIFEPARESIRQAIDEATVTPTVQDIDAYLRRIYMDSYGRLGVLILEPRDNKGNLPTTPDYDTLVNAIQNALVKFFPLPEDVTSHAEYINTNNYTPPVELITVDSNHYIEIFGIAIQTTATSGRIRVYIGQTAERIVAMLVRADQTLVLPFIRYKGDPGESLYLDWSDAVTGYVISLVVTYRIKPVS